MTRLRADLHVHTCYSRHNGTMPFLGARDCYSSPEDVYRTAKSRGMDLVAITDHDSIDGALELLERHPDADDIIVGEEITCWLAGTDVEIHIAAYGMTEALHREVQAHRRNAFEVAAILHQAGVLAALNHPLHFYRDQVPLPAYLRLLDEVAAVEARNGTMLEAHNAFVETLVARWRRPDGGRLAVVAGSDAHTLRRVGRTWTSAPGRSAREFLESVRRGLGQAGGDHGGAGAVAGDAYGVVGRYVASLVGIGSCDLSGWRRAACLAFSAASLPFQFLPLLMAVSGKLAEARVTASANAWLMSADASVGADLQVGPAREFAGADLQVRSTRPAILP